MILFNPSEDTKIGYYEIDGTPNEANTGGSWDDWDVSGEVTAGVEFIDILIEQCSGFDVNAGTRKNGTAINRYRIIADDSSRSDVCPLDTSLICEVMCVGASIEFTVTGEFR